jgi:hypothetical protein
MVVDGGLLADVRGTWRDKAFSGRVRRWQL